MYKEIKKCRICGNKNLVPVLHLGKQALTGVFPRSKGAEITTGPLELVKCHGDPKKRCGLLQLRHSYESDEMYGDNYGYRSGLNSSMVRHLGEKVGKICKMTDLRKGDLVIDIGSNDSTLLRSYPDKELDLVGIDPTARKFAEFYPDHIKFIDDFFSAKIVKSRIGRKKAKVITSIAMFYDLESPISFMKDIADILDKDGIWVFEQSYMPTMLERNAYDTVCHEHLEYYRLKDIKWMTDKVGLKIVDVELNAVNGGSFSVTVAKKGSKKFKKNSALVSRILAEEENKKLSTLEPYKAFEKRVFEHRDALIKFVEVSRKEGKRIFGYGASTKGNVILQLCGFSSEDIPCIAEVNPDKFGSYTPGSSIPITSEKEAKSLRPDYFLVLPWHFKENILQRERDWLASGGKLVFPLPSIETIAGKAQAETALALEDSI